MAQLLEYVGYVHIFLGPYRGNPISLYLRKEGEHCTISPKVYPWNEVIGEGETPSKAAASFIEKWKARGLPEDVYSGPTWEGIKPEKPPPPPKPAAPPKPATGTTSTPVAGVPQKPVASAVPPPPASGAGMTTSVPSGEPGKDPVNSSAGILPASGTASLPTKPASVPSPDSGPASIPVPSSESKISDPSLSSSPSQSTPPQNGQKS